MRTVGSQELGRASNETFFSRNRSAIGLGASLAIAAAGIGSLIYVTMHLRKQDDQNQERKEEDPSAPAFEKKEKSLVGEEEATSGDGKFAWERTADGVLVKIGRYSFFAELSTMTKIKSVDYEKGKPLKILGTVNLGFFSKTGEITVEADYMDHTTEWLNTQSTREANINVPYTITYEPEAEQWRQTVLERCISYLPNPTALTLQKEATKEKKGQLPVTLVMNKSGE